MSRAAISGLFLTALFIASCDPGQPPQPPGGSICMVDGKLYRQGDSFRSPDGCNTCSCQAGGQVACTLIACVDGGAGGCRYGGKSYPVGASFPDTDGCNTCTCTPGGGVACTEKACPPPTSKPCVVGGCSGTVCADEPAITTCEWRPEYACYKQATCARQADGKCGWTKTPELERCLTQSRQ